MGLLEGVGRGLIVESFGTPLWLGTITKVRCVKDASMLIKLALNSTLVFMEDLCHSLSAPLLTHLRIRLGNLLLLVLTRFILDHYEFILALNISVILQLQREIGYLLFLICISRMLRFIDRVAMGILHCPKL